MTDEPTDREQTRHAREDLRPTMPPPPEPDLPARWGARPTDDGGRLVVWVTTRCPAALHVAVDRACGILQGSR